MTDRLHLSCSDVDDLSALYVLDALGAAEAAEVTAHLADHPERHAAFRELAGVTPFLAELVPPLAPPPDLRARVLAQVAVTPQEGPAVRPAATAAPAAAPAPVVDAMPARPAQLPPPGPEPAPAPVPEPYHVQKQWTPAVTPVEPTPPAPISLDAAREAKRRRNPLWAVLAAAAVLAIVALGGWNLALQQQQSQSDQRLAVLSAAAAAAGQPDAAIAPLSGTDIAAGASGYAVFPAAGTGYIVLSGLPAAGEGQAWQAWTIAGESPASAGLMNVGSDGVAVLDGVVALPGTSVVALTVEPAGGSQQPTTTPVVVGQLGSPIAWTGELLVAVAR